MDYPREFPKESRAKVEAEKVRAGRDFETAVKGARWRADEQKHLRTYILRVFLVFGSEAREKRLWPIDEMDRRCREFLRRFTIEARFQKGHGRDLGDMTSNWTGSILSEVQAEFEASPEWKRYEDLLLEVADSRTGGPDLAPGPRAENPEGLAESATPESIQSERKPTVPQTDQPSIADSNRAKFSAGPASKLKVETGTPALDGPSEPSDATEPNLPREHTPETTSASPAATAQPVDHPHLLEMIVAKKAITIEAWAVEHRFGRSTVFDWKSLRSKCQPLDGKVSPQKSLAIEQAIEKDARALGLIDSD
jgi:hypothetical protein